MLSTRKHFCACRFNQVRVGGCLGTSRYDQPRCIDCAVCEVGKYISGPCKVPPASFYNDTYWAPSSADAVAKPDCTACPLCPAGKYMARNCTGKGMGEPDSICLPCASCPMDTYIVPCGLVPYDAATLADIHASGDPLAWLPAPPDAGMCMPCRNCSQVGEHIVVPLLEKCESLYRPL